MLQNLTKLNDVQLRMRYLMSFGQVQTALKERAKMKSTARTSWEVYQIKKASHNIHNAKKTMRKILDEMEKRNLV